MNQRLLSLDVFRGATVALMILVNNPGDWGHIYAPLEHAEWHGCTPTDCVFPFFLFIVGVSISLAMNPQKANYLMYEKILIRALKLFLLGFFLNFFSRIKFGLDTGILLLGIRLFFTAIITVLLLGDFEQKRQLQITISLFILGMILAFFVPGFEAVRIPGVLQRIALVYLFSSLIFLKTSTRTQIILLAIILFGYWFLMTAVPVPNGFPANLEKTTNMGAWLDNLILHGHLWATSKIWDPEGILSTIPAIGTGLAGILAGTWVAKNQANSQKITGLILFGVLGIVFGLLWHEFFPVNKSLWTSSFVVYTAGWASIILGILYWLIDVKGSTFWTLPFVVFGVNAITVFFFSGIIPRALNMILIPTPDGKSIGLQTWLYRNGIAPFFSEPRNASLAGAITFLIIWLGILYFMYRRKIIFKV